MADKDPRDSPVVAAFLKVDGGVLDAKTRAYIDMLTEKEIPKMDRTTAINEVYNALRVAGYATLQAMARLRALGLTLDEVETAAKARGDM